MIKFNKVFNSKVISLILACVFLFTNITYGIDIPERSHLRKPLDFNSLDVTPRYICALLAFTYHNGILKHNLSPEQALARAMERIGIRNVEERGIKVEKHEGSFRISYEQDNIDITAYNDGRYGPKQAEHAVEPKVKRSGEAVVAQQVAVKIKPVIDLQKLMPTTAQKSAILFHPLAMIFWAFALKVGFVFTFGLITRDMEATTNLYWSLWYLNQALLSISTYIFIGGWVILPLINTAPYILNKIGLLNSDYLKMAPIERANAALAELKNEAENLSDKQIGREALYILSYVKGFYSTNFLNIFRGGGTDHLERIVRISTGELGISSMVSANKAALKSLIYRRALILYLADSRNGFKTADVNDSASTRWVKVNLHLRHRALDTWYMTFYYFMGQFYAGQFRIGKLFAHSNLQATPAVSSNGQSIPAAIDKRVQAGNIERVTLTSALIGKYELLTNPVFDEANGTIKFMGRSIDTGKVEEIALNANRAPPETIERIKQILSALLKTDNNAINKILSWFDSSFSGQILLLEDNTQNIFGLGASNLIAINKSFSNNPIALFHEIAEAAINAGIITTEEIISSLQDRTWYDAHIAKGGRENLRPHYALRALQREVFKWANRDLTTKIKVHQQSIKELFESLSSGAFKWFDISSRVKVLFNKLSPQERVDLFAKILRDDYNLRSLQSYAISAIAMGQKRSVWEDALGYLVLDNPEDLPYITSLLMEPDMSEAAKSYIWNAVEYIAIKYPLEAVKALHAVGFESEKIVDMAMARNVPNRNAERIVLYLLLSVQPEASEIAQSYAKLILAFAEESLRQGQPFNASLVENALNLLEPSLPSDKKVLPWRSLTETKAEYINQLFIINDIFQEALKLVSENPDIPYEELYRRLITEGPGQENFNHLTKKQRVLVKSVLIRSRTDRLRWRNEFEEARKNYPIDKLNNASSEIAELYKKRKEYLKSSKTDDAMALHQVIQRISVLRLRLVGLRRDVAPFLEKRFGILAKDVPEIAIIRLGNFGLELYVDSESLQRAFNSREKEVVEKGDKYFFDKEFRFSKHVDITMLRNVLRKFPQYVFGNFQNEMVAYLTGAELRSEDFDELLDIYMDKYLDSLLEYIKRQDWFNEFVKANSILEGTLEALIAEVRTGPEWQKTKQTLKEVKKLLDDLVDVKATLLYYKMKAENPESNTEELTARAYREASSYILGIFQLIPILKADDRLKNILAQLKRQLEERGISNKDVLTLPIKKKEPNKDGSPTLWAGFQRDDVIVSDIEGGIRVVDHEGQHLIFRLYTGREVISHTRYTSNFYGFMDKVLLTAEYNNLSLYENENISGNAQIGKRAQLESIDKDTAKVKDSKGNIQVLRLTPHETIDIPVLKVQIESMQNIDQTYKQLILAILSLLENSPPEERPQFYTFDTLIEDLFGFARPEYNLIALHQDFITNPIALFHEIGEYLVHSPSASLILRLESNNLIASINGEQYDIVLEGEALTIAQKVEKDHKDYYHYLLRALQREIFGEKDRELTQEIKQLQTIARNIFWPILSDEDREDSKNKLAMVTTLLPSIIEQVIPEYKDNIEAVYLIGGFLFKKPPTDLDLVVIVRDNVDHLSIARDLPKEISQRLGSKITNFLCDIKIFGKDAMASDQPEKLRYLSGVYKSGILLSGSDLLIEPQNNTLVALAKELSYPGLMQLKGSYFAMAILIAQQTAGILKDVPIERIRKYLKQGILYYHIKSIEEYEEIFRVTSEIAGFDIDSLDLVRGLPEVIEQVPGEDEEIAKIILNGVGKDIENIRDPNKLCGWIANFTFNDTSVDPYKVLEFILEEFDQIQYLDIYKEVLGIKISKAQKMRRPPLLELIERDWDVIDTTNLEELLGSLKPSRETRKIELEEVEMSPLGHGILSSHSPEELGDLKDGMRMINKWVEEKRIMGEEKVSNPFIIHGIEIPLDGRPVIMDVNNHSFIIKAFKDRVVIEAQGTYSMYSLFEGVYMRSGFSGIAALGGIEFMFYREGNKIILKPLHEILQIHRIIANTLTVNGAFGIRKAEKGLYRADSGFRDLLIYSEPEDIPRLMNKYFKWLEKEEYRIQENSPEALHPVELAAQAFCKLLWIHPFENGNTRTAGLVMNYILMKNGFPPFMLNAANERRFYELERFMNVPVREEFSKLEQKSYRIIDEGKIFSFSSDEYTAFLASQIALQMATNAQEQLLDVMPSLSQRNALSSSI